jgi:hypothetical protein
MTARVSRPRHGSAWRNWRRQREQTEATLSSDHAVNRHDEPAVTA